MRPQLQTNLLLLFQMSCCLPLRARPQYQRHGRTHGEVRQATLLTLSQAQRAKAPELTWHAVKHVVKQRSWSLYCSVKKKKKKPLAFGTGQQGSSPLYLSYSFGALAHCLSNNNVTQKGRRKRLQLFFSLGF